MMSLGITGQRALYGTMNSGGGCGNEERKLNDSVERIQQEELVEFDNKMMQVTNLLKELKNNS
jgi:hypothetical protein